MNHTVEEVKLKNGARGLLIDIPGATVMNTLFHFRAGNRFAKTKEIEQVAHIMEHMAFGANAKYSNQQAFEAEFTKNGAYHNAYTSDFSMVYESDCADFEWDRILELQKVSICQPRFNNAELKAEKGNVKNELTGYLNDHYRILWPRIQQLMGEDTLTERQALATIPNVKLADIKEHHLRTHTTNNMRFVIAGKLQGRKAEILRQLEAFELPKGERLEIPKDNLTKASPTIVRRKDAANLPFVFLMSINRVLEDEELDALSALNHILTSTTTSRIYGKARSKGIAYFVGSYCSSSLYDSSWEISGEVNHDTSQKLFEIISKEIGDVLNGQLTEAEIDAAKSFSLGRYQMGAQTVAQISGFYTNRYFMSDEIKDYTKVPDMIRKVSKEKIIAVAKEFINADTWILGAVSNGDKEEIVDLANKVEKLFIKG